MNHQRICIILFVFVALICQIYISAAPHGGPGPEKLPNETNVSPVPVKPQPAIELPTTELAATELQTTTKSDASNVMILPTALFATFVIHMF
uniref:Uncharacterized protein n=1 Tax=Panagrolaimus sp. PS1159 TaxID=55785 RepID=A0AC35GC62_9BILA